MKNKLALLLSLLLLSCDKDDVPKLPKVKDGSSAKYTVYIEQSIFSESGDYMEMHKLTGRYSYSLKVEDGFYNIKIDPDFFFFDNKPISLPQLNEEERTNFKIPIEQDVKKSLKAFLKNNKTSLSPGNPDAVYEKSLLGMIPQLTKFDKNMRCSILEETSEKITLSTTNLYKLPKLSELKHNLECNDTSVQVISNETGLLISSETTSVTQGLIFAENAPKPLNLTIKAKIITKSL